MLEDFLAILSPEKEVVPIELKDKVAEILRVSPEALAVFEESYQKSILEAGWQTDNLLDRDRQTARGTQASVELQKEVPAELVEQIVNELLAQTWYMNWDGKTLTRGACSCVENLPTAINPESGKQEPVFVTKEQLAKIDPTVRPQLTGNYAQRDLPLTEISSYVDLLEKLDKSRKAEDFKTKEWYYFLFRQGLDMMDLDPVMYAILSKNPSSIGHWFPALCKGIMAQGEEAFFKIPATRIIRAPISVMQMSRLEYSSLTKGTMRVIDRFAVRAFELDRNREYFVKTGLYSSKFDFRNAHVVGAKEVDELGEYLLYIQHQASCMAGPLMRPCSIGTATTNEWVVREYIPDCEGNTTIYKGLPLRTEYRVFVDVDEVMVLGVVPYWEPTLMKKRFAHEPDANSPHQVHDYITFTANEPRLTQRFEQNKERVSEEVARLLPGMREAGLTGQWSLDIMQNGDDFYAIDMATAETSALSELLPPGTLKPKPEDWLPDYEVYASLPAKLEIPGLKD